MVESTTGTAKLTVLAAAIDDIKHSQSKLAEKVHDLAAVRSTNLSYDSEIETLELSELATKYSVTEETLRKQIRSTLGYDAVIKVGKRWVIRKTNFLSYLRKRERDNPGSNWEPSLN